MRRVLHELPAVKLRPIFVEVMPPFDSIKTGEIWISHKHRTVNLRCPCGCGDLTVLTLHPSRWHVHFDGKSVSLDGPTGRSVWAISGCGSHYGIKDNAVIWMDRIDRGRHSGVCRRRAGAHVWLNTEPSDSSFTAPTRMAQSIVRDAAKVRTHTLP